VSRFIGQSSFYAKSKESGLRAHSFIFCLRLEKKVTNYTPQKMSKQLGWLVRHKTEEDTKQQQQQQPPPEPAAAESNDRNDITALVSLQVQKELVVLSTKATATTGRFDGSTTNKRLYSATLKECVQQWEKSNKRCKILSYISESSAQQQQHQKVTMHNATNNTANNIIATNTSAGVVGNAEVPPADTNTEVHRDVVDTNTTSFSVEPLPLHIYETGDKPEYLHQDMYSCNVCFSELCSHIYQCSAGSHVYCAQCVRKLNYVPAMRASVVGEPAQQQQHQPNQRQGRNSRRRVRRRIFLPSEYPFLADVAILDEIDPFVSQQQQQHLNDQSQQVNSQEDTLPDQYGGEIQWFRNDELIYTNINSNNNNNINNNHNNNNNNNNQQSDQPRQTNSSSYNARNHQSSSPVQQFNNTTTTTTNNSPTLSDGELAGYFNCAMCRVKSHVQRNRILEQILAPFVITCKQPMCHTKALTFGNHQEECAYRAFRCPFCFELIESFDSTEIDRHFLHGNHHRNHTVRIYPDLKERLYLQRDIASVQYCAVEYCHRRCYLFFHRMRQCTSTGSSSPNQNTNADDNNNNNNNNDNSITVWTVQIWDLSKYCTTSDQVSNDNSNDNLPRSSTPPTTSSLRNNNNIITSNNNNNDNNQTQIPAGDTKELYEILVTYPEVHSQWQLEIDDLQQQQQQQQQQPHLWIRDHSFPIEINSIDSISNTTATTDNNNNNNNNTNTDNNNELPIAYEMIFLLPTSAITLPQSVYKLNQTVLIRRWALSDENDEETSEVSPAEIIGRTVYNLRIREKETGRVYTLHIDDIGTDSAIDVRLTP
jgi:hypothetical protein